ncbi:3-hydroxy-3-methylglutaryl- reductase [Vairimorpha apis BRL 01]|uniref:hydroxymethylglutaryl-CoA reductase (NADPH) n=1 Tax=Vairimorpha apis BRL 01 TaxID=1037528 RepID=T0L7L4_9MICR|nr:3-hydroxy-3-methylglutaryl- reductase [Vairimorpha apis BRL 01]
MALEKIFDILTEQPKKSDFNQNNTTKDKKLNEQIIEKSKHLRDKIKKDKNIEFIDMIYDDDFTTIYNRCCENILGYRKVPMGVSHNPVIINYKSFYIPICTFEGALVASMCRGIKLINKSNGVLGFVENLGITRSFALDFCNFETACKFYQWIKLNENINLLKNEGNKNSRYCRIKKIECKNMYGSIVFIKVSAFTGDAMGMNMITKACNQIASKIIEMFKNTKLVTISANICTDKKWSIENYCNGRGKKVFLHIKIKEVDLKSIMHVTIDDILKVYHTKIVLGGSIVLGGFNCQASNYVAATFLAFNQDLGHVLESSNCTIDMKKNNDCLEVNLLMPSVIVGTVGGGTHLEPACSLFKQFKNLENSFNINHIEDLSKESNHLALLVATSVLAGELSAMSSLAENTLMDAHLRLNRK